MSDRTRWRWRNSWLAWWLNRNMREVEMWAVFLLVVAVAIILWLLGGGEE